MPLKMFPPPITMASSTPVLVKSSISLVSLSKNLDVQFILPLINPEKAIAEDAVKFTDTVMSALGVLQGLVYPRKYGFSYPYLLGVSIGEVYTNFKAFLRDVSIKFDGPMIDIGGKMFPQIITGTLRFINVFFYAWGDKDGSFLESMDLYKNPRVLFGEKTLGTEATNIKNNVSEYTAASNLFSLSSTFTVEGFFGKPEQLKCIHLPPGEFELTDALVISEPLLISGEGPEVSTLIYNGNGSAITFSYNESPKRAGIINLKIT
mgnify:CR=1 FL=1